MKNTIVAAAFSLLVLSGTAFAGTNVNGFAYQLQKANEITVNAVEDKNNSSKESVVGSQVMYSETALNINGRALQEIHVAEAAVTAANVNDSVVGIQVAKSNGVINVNGSVEQLMFAADVAVKASNVDNSVVGAQVIHAKGDLNVNGATKQMLFAENIAVSSNGSGKSVVGAQVIAGR
ncbi:MAG TPA: hypothetical protein PLE99_02100 [Candidatus Thiothrix moscowensis]|uniref:hypothetical protein n=1 Tax=unclassified Thiothrix TaxID=2636184 RepID=UPI0025D44B67|nr:MULTISPECIES: hypothetical protein [unclassified Thiothrix]HRJ51531.1 hypothetical protein [Candidatus Thiothrix moscowensis]HRJ91846.1 hypothetical protein [Candidatus Thiothrix moscowensis]